MHADQYIGKGEQTVQRVLMHLYGPSFVKAQVPIKDLIPQQQAKFLGAEYEKHKHDLTVYIAPADITVAIEVNLKHGSIAHKKWNNVYKPNLEACGILTCTIDDYECPSIFNDKIQHPNWDDYIEVLNSLKKQNIPLY